jgi:BASS family bile acid:Na+ symporter
MVNSVDIRFILELEGVLGAPPNPSPSGGLPMPFRIKEILIKFNRILEQRMFLVIFSGLLLGLLFPGLDRWKALVPILFGYMTLVTALNISWKGVFGVITMPGPILLILLLLHGVMPLFSLSISSLVWGVSSQFTVGMVLAVLIPIGVTSVIWTGLAKGETPLALTAVTIDSLISPFLVPISAVIFLGRSVQLDSRSLMIGLFWMIVLPTIVGISLHDLSKGSIGPAWSHINGPLSKIALSFVVAINVAAAQEIIIKMHTAFGPLLALLCLQVLAGYLVGFWAAKAFKYTYKRAVGVTFSVGMRNISAGIVIALQYFSPQAAIPVVLAMLFQQPLASLFHKWLIRKEGIS